MKLKYNENRMQLYRTTLMQMNFILIAALFVTVNCKCKSKVDKKGTTNPLQSVKVTKHVNGYSSAAAITNQPVSSSVLTPSTGTDSLGTDTQSPGTARVTMPTPSPSNGSTKTPTPSPGTSSRKPPTPAPVAVTGGNPTPHPIAMPIGRQQLRIESQDSLSDDDDNCEYNSGANSFSIDYTIYVCMCLVAFKMYLL